MTTLFVDTNVFLRFLTDDHPQQAQKARDFLETAIETPETTLVTSDAVVMELVYTLRSYYGRSQSETEKKVMTILEFCLMVSPVTDFDWQGVFQGEPKKNVDFMDALNYRIMKQEGLETIVSFDTDYDRFEDITRQEPE
ncbi:MAG TPA: PIN domain-containing protein [bacterium]|nr:PIN domain-containing protein [bacterium]